MSNRFKPSTSSSTSSSSENKNIFKTNSRWSREPVEQQRQPQRQPHSSNSFRRSNDINRNNNNNNNKKYVPPGSRNRNNFKHRRNNHSERRSPSVNTFNWEKKKREAEEKKKLEQLSTTQENFPSLSSNSNKSITQEPPQAQAQAQELTGIRAKMQTSLTTHMTNSYKEAIKKKRAAKKREKSIDPGWVILRRVNGKTVFIKGKTVKKEPRQPNQQQLVANMMEKMRECQIEGMLRDPFWDNRMDEYEEIVAEANRSDSESSSYDDDGMEDDDDFYENNGGGGGGGGKWWTS